MMEKYENVLFMFTGKNCSKCKRAKMMLENVPNEKGIIVQELNIDEYSKDVIDGDVDIHPSDSKEICDVMGVQMLPTFFIKKEGVELDIKNKDSYDLIIGFDESQGKIMEVFGL